VLREEGGLSVREVVVRDDLVAAGEERVHEVRADEAGSACDEVAGHQDRL